MDRLAELERLADETGNPVFAWEALSLCEKPEELPAWAWDYLSGCASRLLELEPDPKRLAAAVLDALWLSGSGGPGLFKRATAARRRREALEHMAELLVAGANVDDAAKQAAEGTGLSWSTLRGYHFEGRRRG